MAGAVIAERVLDELVGELEGSVAEVARNVPIAQLTTYRIGGPAAVLVRVDDEDQLLALAEHLAPRNIPVLVVGRGSNLLVADRGFAGVAIALGEGFEHVVIDDSTVTAGGAVALPVLARRSAAAGRRGLEFYVGIPGSVGGAVRMNAGGHGRETAGVLVSARVVDLAAPRVSEIIPADLAFGYRRSAIRSSAVVTSARFAVERDAAASCEERVAEVVRWRREHQPVGANAGSVFTNPPGDAAGRLIDAAGLRGFRVGGAEVSEKHANFFQADPGAPAGDVHELVVEVRRRVAERFGVHLVPELEMIGFDEDER